MLFQSKLAYAAAIVALLLQALNIPTVMPSGSAPSDIDAASTPAIASDPQTQANTKANSTPRSVKFEEQSLESTAAIEAAFTEVTRTGVEQQGYNPQPLPEVRPQQSRPQWRNER